MIIINIKDYLYLKGLEFNLPYSYRFVIEVEEYKKQSPLAHSLYCNFVKDVILRILFFKSIDLRTFQK